VELEELLAIEGLRDDVIFRWFVGHERRASNLE
jgi:hypothetical protein